MGSNPKKFQKQTDEPKIITKMLIYFIFNFIGVVVYRSLRSPNVEDSPNPTFSLIT